MVNKLNRQCRFPVNKLTYRNLGGKNTAAMKPGERIIVCTPGGGGYGTPDELDGKDKQRQNKIYARDQWRGTGSIANYQAIQESA
jgi:5-oxoprolinase (ATP-hydrolysing)